MTLIEWQRVAPRGDTQETRNSSDEDDDMASAYDQHWHLDKKVPITIIFAIVIQTLGFIWIGSAWKADVDARLKQLETSDAERKPQESRLIRVEERLLTITESNRRIETKLEALLQGQNGPQP